MLIVHAGLVIGPNAAVDLSDYAQGNLEFDLKIINAGNNNLSGGFLVKLKLPRHLILVSFQSQESM